MKKTISIKNGFHLVELLIVVAIVGIMAMISIPLYTHHMVQSNRLMAKMSLMKLASALENYYTLHDTYENATLAELNVSNQAIQKTYQLAIVSATEMDFIIEANPIGYQAEKDDCGSLRLDAHGSKSMTGTGTFESCW